MKQVGLFRNENVTLPPLPEGEAWLKGLTIQSYWITNYIANINSKFEIKFSRETQTGWYASIMGGGTGSSSRDKIQITIDPTYKNLYGSFGLYGNGDATFEPNTTYTVILEDGKCTINGSESTFSSAFSPGSALIWIGAMNFSGSLDAEAIKGKIYYLKIWENGTLVRNYQPQSDLTFKCSITGHVAALTGSAEYGTDD